MSNLLYLLIALVLSGVGWLIIWLRHRQPTSTEYSVQEFSRELRALAPDQRHPQPRDPRRDRIG